VQPSILDEVQSVQVIGKEFDEFGPDAGVYDQSDIDFTTQQKPKVVERDKGFATEARRCVICYQDYVHAGPGADLFLLGAMGRVWITLSPFLLARAPRHSRITKKPPMSTEAELIASDMAMSDSSLQTSSAHAGDSLFAAAWRRWMY
jgi:hypothetical protein